MRDALRALYSTNHQRVVEAVRGFPEHINGPYYVWPNDKYLNTDTRVVFVGQETNGWTSGDVEQQIKQYEDFNIGERYRKGVFWNFIRKCELAISGDKLNSVALNLNRFDENTDRPSPALAQRLNTLDDLILNELELLDPEIVIWLTSWHNDGRISQILDCDPFSVDGFDHRVLAEFQSSEIRGLNFRTYHPRYLRQGGHKENVLNFLRDAISIPTESISPQTGEFDGGMVLRTEDGWEIHCDWQTIIDTAKIAKIARKFHLPISLTNVKPTSGIIKLRDLLCR